MISKPLSRLRSFYSTYLPLGDFLGEMFYAVWMVVVSLGILGGTGFEGGAITYVIIIAFTVNTVWGLMDGLTVMHSNIIERVSDEKIIYDLQTRGDIEARKLGTDALSEGITSVLNPADREKVLDMIASSAAIEDDPAEKPHHPRREDWNYALGILSIDVLLVIPLVAPFLIFPEPFQALFFSRLVATAIFAALGAFYAKHLNRRRWLAALFLGTLCSSLFIMVFLAGW